MRLSPQAASVLPLLYLAWNDSVMSPHELSILQNFISNLEALSDDDKDYLLKYTDVNNSPNTEDLKSWLDRIKRDAHGINNDGSSTLPDLCSMIAQVNLKGAYAHQHTQLIQSYEAVTQALGLNKVDKVTDLYRLLGLRSDASLENKVYDFDPKKLGALLDYFGHDTKHKLELLLDDFTLDSTESKDKDILRSQTLDVVRELAKRGYGALAYDTAYGGKNDFVSYVKTFETLCGHNMNYAVKLGVQFGLFGGSIANLGTTYHHDKYLYDVGRAELLGCFAMTETGHGSNVKDLETTATYDHDSRSIVIHSPTPSSGKEYIGNALHGSLAVVFAQLYVDGINHGVHAIIVPYRDEDSNTLAGIVVKDCGYKLGLNGVDNGRLWFDQVAVPKENLLNRFGDIDEHGKYVSKIENPNKRFFTMLGALVGGRVCVGLGALEASKVALSITIKHALIRRQFKPDDFHDETLLMDYPTHQHRLFPLVVKNIVYKNALHQLTLQYDQKDESQVRKIETKAAGLKAVATWHATKTIQECREACGGKGYLAENRIADLKADSDIFTTFEGDNHVLLQLVAKGLLTEFQQSFSDDGFMATLRYIGGKIGFTMSELNLYKTRSTDRDHILDDDSLSDALRYREKKMLISLSDRMRRLIKDKHSPHEAFLKCQVHMVDYARSYIERLAYREMIKRLDAIENSAEKEILIKINRFFALSLLMDHRYWYLENDFMDGSKTKAIRRVYSELMREMRENIEGIIEAWGVKGEYSVK